MGVSSCGFKSHPRHQIRHSKHEGLVVKLTWRRSQVVKAEVCKTSIRRFESARRLHPLYFLAHFPIANAP